MKSHMLALAVLPFAITTVSATAATVETGAFIAAPTFINDFEDIDQSPNFKPPDFFGGNKLYAQNGISVVYVEPGVVYAERIWTQALHTGEHGWYVNGGGNGYTRITLTNGADFTAVQFGAATGGYTATGTYELRRDGAIVQSGAFGSLVGYGFATYGFSGGGFDEVRLTAPLNFSGGYEEGVFELLAIDDLAATAAGVPEPASWALLVGGFGMIGGTLRRRHRLDGVSSVT